MSPRRATRDLALAVTQLTAVPLSVTWPDDERPSVSAWYPWVGLGLGMLLVLSTWLMRLFSPPLVAALVGVVVLASVTRLLHWDGLADVCDAWLAAPSRRLEIAGDSRIGAFGAFGLALLVVTHVLLLEARVGTAGAPDWALLGVPVFGRLSATFAAWFGSPAKTTGLGAAVIGRPSAPAVIIGGSAIIALAAAWGLSTGLAWWVFGLALIVSLAVPHLISMRFGGVTGDVMGASIIITEALVLALLVTF
jgi:adenosylcobinamide-GDP ribazoletransferase